MAAILAPVLVILAILFVGVDRPEASSSTAKGMLQVILTGTVSGTSGFSGNPNVSLNVVSVRLHPSSDLTVPDDDPNWQTIAVPSGSTRGDTNPSLTLGGSFGPNGQAVSVGMGRSEIQIDLGLINSATIFNTGKVKAITYGQVELILDPTTPGNLVPPCGVGTSTGEGCIVYPLVFPPTFTSIRTATQFTVTRKTTQPIVVDIGAALSAGPQTSNQQVIFTPSICVVPLSGTVPNPQCPAPASSLVATDFTALVTGSVTGGTKKTTVNAELPNTGTIVSSVTLDEATGSQNTFTMVLPVANLTSGTSCLGALQNCSATYDIYAATPGFTNDIVQAVKVFNTGPSTTNSPLTFTITKQGGSNVKGKVFDACSGGTIAGVTLDLYAPATSATGTDCNLGSGQIPSTCSVIAEASTDATGSFPLPGNGTQASPFLSIPKFTKGEYALKASASGFNSEILAVETGGNGTFQCPGSGFKNKECDFSLPHGEIDVFAQLSNDSFANATTPFNLLVTAEDTGTFNGEGVTLVTIPLGSQMNSAPVPVFVPASPTPTPTAAAAESAFSFDADAKATPSPTPTTVFIGSPPSYDLFASVQDLFGAAPQKNTGHTIAAVSGVSPPTYCQNTVSVPAAAPTVTLPMVGCVGHGSVSGTALNPDQNTLMVVSKASGDSEAGPPVDLMTTTVIGNGQQSGGAFAICAPVDAYTVTHVESQPTGTPVAGSSVSVMMTPPVIISTPTPASTPTAPACNGICSDFSGSNSGKSCLLCQSTGSIPGAF